MKVSNKDTHIFACQLVKYFVSLRKESTMKAMSVGEFKANFSEVLKRVLAGEEIGILYGRKKEIVAKIVPKTKEKKPRRKIGILEGKAHVTFGPGFKMTEEEFLGV